MTITISEQCYFELLQEEEKSTQVDPTDCFYLTEPYPKLLGQGYFREIELRDGLFLEIFDCQLRDRLIWKLPERHEHLSYHFHLLGNHQDYDTEVNNKEFSIYGSGLYPQENNDGEAQTALEVTIYVDPKTLLSFISDRTGQLPKGLQHLIKPTEQIRYSRVGKVTPILGSLLWQILRCPFQGITKRIYLESKALELISFVIEEEIEIYKGKQLVKPLKRSTLDCIHHAKTILLQNLDRPPTLAELAKQVQLNEYTLKKGFQQVFHTTIFACIKDYRLEQAKQLLETGQMSVCETMKAVGFRDRHHFCYNFRQKFGINPRDYLMSYKRTF
jgi:AraC-like DNA-binding protein